MDEKFCLRWDEFQSNVSKYFNKLRNENDFFDVTLVSDDQKQISAHKVVLSSCSEYFKNVLKQNKHPHPLLCLEGISFKDLSNILDYIYNGEIKLYQRDLDSFVTIAERLKLEGLIGSGDNLSELFEEEQKYEINEFPTQEITNQKLVVDSDFSEAPEKKVRMANENKIIVTSEDFQNIEELDAAIMENMEKSGIGKWNCNFCKRQFKRKEHTKEHIETHFDGLKFPCQYCDYFTKTRHSLRDHVRNQHKQIKQTTAIKKAIFLDSQLYVNF